VDGSERSDEVSRPPWLERISAAQGVRLDVLLAAFFLAGALVHLYFGNRLGPAAWYNGSRWALTPLYVLAIVPIAVRRRWPVPALVVTTAALTLTTMLGHTLAPLPLIALPLYSVTMSRPRRTSLVALILVEAASVVSLGVGALYNRNHGEVTFNIILALATWFIADSIRTRREYLSGLAEQEEARRQRELDSARRAIVEQRLEIAREMHDVVAHSLSVIAVQSGVGRHVADAQPHEARKALAAVETTSRTALEELRQVLGVLRRPDRDGADRLPAPSLDDLDTLVDGVRGAGVAVSLERRGEPRPLPKGLELSIYRIVQEALTNVVKHTDRAPTTVRITFGADDVEVDVVNRGSSSTTGGARPASAHDGHGIVGMSERAAAFGGTLRTTPLADGGFQVLARLKTREPA
jgi:signal transduction histidine kinase